MSDSEDDFLSADEGSDVDELPSSIKEDNDPVSLPTSVVPLTKSISDISDTESLQSKVEQTSKTSETETTEAVKDKILDSKERNIIQDDNLQEVDTENNIIEESVLEKVLDKDIEPQNTNAKSNNGKDITEETKIEESKTESESLETLTNKVDDINLEDEQNNEVRNSSTLDDKKCDVHEEIIDKLPSSDNTETNEKESTLKKTENISEESCTKPVLQSTTDSSVQKPIKTSKIGAKKNKEKLGSKLGAKKLGSRMPKQTQESAIQDNKNSLVDNTKENDNLENRLQEKKADIMVEDVDDKQRLLEAKRRQEEEWEQQQSRWQEAQGIKPMQQSQQSQESSDGGWGGWGGWGTTLISAVGTITQEVGRGVGTVMETVEGGLGVPDPENLARELAERERQIEEEKLKKSGQSKDSIENIINNTWDSKELGKSSEDHEIQNDNRSPHELSSNEETQGNFSLTSITGLSTNSFGGFGSMVTGASKVFETASNKVLLGGLDTLELIGQKAMDTIQKGDPGLKKKRAFLIEDTPNLAATLREASKFAESKDQQKQITPQIPTLHKAWDNTEGPVHLEALSLVAKQCQGKTSKLMQALPPHLLTRLNNMNSEITTCLDEVSDDSLIEDIELFSMLDTIVEGDGLPIQIDKIKKAWSDLDSTTSSITSEGTEIGSAIECQFYTSYASLLSQMASTIHKNSEMALITPDVAPLDIAVQFKRLTGLIGGSVDTLADKVCSFITAQSSAADPQVNNVVTNIYLQVSEGNNYMQESLKHLSTVLQYSNTKKCISDL